MRVAILGTGLIGSSIGLRLRRPGAAQVVEVVGYDRGIAVAREAQQRGAVDRVAATPQEAVAGADLVILAAPVLAIRTLLEEIAPAVAATTVITDTGSTKAAVLRWAQESLPQHAGFVGGHPMAGKTESGPGAAAADLFEGARWVIVAPVRAAEAAVERVRWLAEQLGARPQIMDADEHDAYVAAISHMPMLTAATLFAMVHASDAWPELAQLAAGGFRDTTRLTATDPAMAFDIAVTNREQTLHWIDRYLVALGELRERLADVDGDEALLRWIAATQLDYVAFRDGREGDREPSAAASALGSPFGGLLAGGWARDKIEAAMRDAEERLHVDERRPRGDG